MSRLRPFTVAVGLVAALACVSCGVERFGPARATRTPAPRLSVNRSYITGLDHPWDMAFIPNGTMFFTERAGRIKARLPGGAINLLATPSDVVQGGEGGMLGIAIDPGFAVNRYMYTCMTSNRGSSTDVRVVRWVVNSSVTGLSNRTDIVTGINYSSGRHSGCRPRFKPGTLHLYVGTGDAATGSFPQNPWSLAGKILRVDGNGVAIPGNPGGVYDPRIYSWGHRNVQGIAFQPGTGSGLSVEHGTDVDDEVNLIVPGNFGWNPDDGAGGYDESTPMTRPGGIGAVWRSGDSLTPPSNPGVTIAPSGATFLSGRQWKGWNGALAVAVLKDMQLRIMLPNSMGIIAGNNFVANLGGSVPRLRSAVEGPDGRLYIATDDGSPTGAIWRVTPS
jgi:glucose/arabinose dehydrogenase